MHEKESVSELMDSTPFVTLIIPVYNICKDDGAMFLRCVNSIKAQTFTDWRAIVINDGSTDASYEFVKSYCGQDERFSIYTHENMGVAKTRDRGVRLAESEYVAFIDQDDWIEADYLANFCGAAKASRSNVILGGYKRLDASGKRISGLDPNIVTPFFKWIIMVPWARLFNREFLVSNDVRFFDNNIGEDIVFNSQIYVSTNQIEVIPYTGYIWFYNDNSVSNTLHVGLKSECNFDNLLDHLFELHSSRSDPYFNHAILRLCIWYLLYSGRGSTQTRFVEYANHLFERLREHGISRQFHFWDRRIACDPLFNRLSISAFLLIRRLHATGAFAALYCGRN